MDSDTNFKEVIRNINIGLPYKIYNSKNNIKDNYRDFGYDTNHIYDNRIGYGECCGAWSVGNVSCESDRTSGTE